VTDLVERLKASVAGRPGFEVVYCGDQQTVARKGSDGVYRCYRCGKPVRVVETNG
jgi:hypothetical protein